MHSIQYFRFQHKLKSTVQCIMTAILILPLNLTYVASYRKLAGINIDLIREHLFYRLWKKHQPTWESHAYDFALHYSLYYSFKKIKIKVLYIKNANWESQLFKNYTVIHWLKTGFSCLFILLHLLTQVRSIPNSLWICIMSCLWCCDFHPYL